MTKIEHRDLTDDYRALSAELVEIEIEIATAGKMAGRALRTERQALAYHLLQRLAELRKLLSVEQSSMEEMMDILDKHQNWNGTKEVRNPSKELFDII